MFIIPVKNMQIDGFCIVSVLWQVLRILLMSAYLTGVVALAGSLIVTVNKDIC